jgi:hypothetical protein
VARPGGQGDSPARSARHDATIEANWELFLAGYKANDPDSREQLMRNARDAGMNRHQRRKFESRVRKYKNRRKASA